ncbi:hypothetical protein OS493_031706 [Desmophyllum pertusum]|uniref:Uncharacterized protein n=1 Tax=Desmophyllum pertusum TaxID=174260 RepID=A0A9X0D175_9CNID|nr:hypothetical protein OS493_031706 [Desmophyllum pertusum]
MEYYCTLREYESQFFKKLYKEPTADCGQQFWNLYYLSKKKAKTCLGNSKKLEVANIEEIQLLYCSGLDLEIPLMFSLSPCSSVHKRKVDKKRGKAKLCAVATWEANCNKSEIADGIYNKVISEFNPFCSNEKDPWASEPDLCAYNDPKTTPKPTDKKVVKKNAAGIRHGVAPVSLNLFALHGGNFVPG